mmetsp:Transcript_1923/g.2745  ORF Transcript_1923/g.2745 Transcript_1923/m.2745 type:complete len:138 (-) Transcript_1923:1382-1795(-)
MQTSAIEFRSHQGQTSKQDALSAINQTSEIDVKSNQMQTSQFERKNEIACQTEKKYTRRVTPVKKNKNFQTEKQRTTLDAYKEDWANSAIYKRAMRVEAIRLGLPIEEYETDDDQEDDEAVWKIDDEASSVDIAFNA